MSGDEGFVFLLLSPMIWLDFGINPYSGNLAAPNPNESWFGNKNTFIITQSEMGSN